MQKAFNALAIFAFLGVIYMISALNKAGIGMDFAKTASEVWTWLTGNFAVILVLGLVGYILWDKKGSTTLRAKFQRSRRY